MSIDNSKMKKVLEQLNSWCTKHYPQVQSVYDDCGGYTLQQLVYYLLGVVKENTSLTTSATDQYNELYTFVNDYFNNLDVQEEINNKLNSMTEDGTLSELIQPIINQTLPPLFVDSTTEMTNKLRIYILKSNSHIYQYVGDVLTDTGVVFGGTIGNVITYLLDIDEGSDANTLSVNTIYFRNLGIQVVNFPTDRSGWIFTVGESKRVILQFYITPEFSTYYRVYSSSKWSEWSNTNDNIIKYTGSVESGADANNISAQTIMFRNSSIQDVANFPTAMGGFITTVGVNQYVLLQLYIDTQFNINIRFFSSGVWHEWSNIYDSTLKYKGVLSENLDMNDLEPQTYYFKNSSTTGIINAPTTNGGVVVTMCDASLYLCQLYIDTTDNIIYIRRYISTGWSDWSYKTYNEDNTGNQNASMTSFVNSMFVGGVWIDGAYNRLSEYNNAPYGIIANSIGINKENVNNTYLGGTGILYDNGEGNFLSHIKSTNFSDTDVLLTHFWVSDMNESFDIGSIDSTAGDGTLAGAIVDIVNYVKTSNGLTQIIICSIPPTSSDIYGENVFTGSYPNGKSISELDKLMHSLSEKYKFVYIDWQELSFATYYHNFTDELNVHANNENTYRLMGGYLGGRISSRIHF